MSAKASTSTKRPTYEEMICEAIIVMKALNKGVEKELFEMTMTKLDEPSERSKTKVSKPKTTKKPSVVKDKKKVSKDNTVKKPSTAKTSKKTSTAKSPKKTSTVKSTKKASTAKVLKKTSTVKVPKKSSTRTTKLLLE
ncbi:16046_t:CDS:2, partial [Gigaspora rosea]